ncbi:hypothetical protein L6452_39025 [Arctium lappa]|uniref:Uncharacterized protein n=1 Tax=Arctium lappa TaxID=4217 RepID=A0ACB8XSD0_ARCLA|nr:hypothetical protein L6452_39025 [Arctium lappa]
MGSERRKRTARKEKKKNTITSANRERRKGKELVKLEGDVAYKHESINYVSQHLLRYPMNYVEETAISSDIPILQEINSSELQLWVELPILDNVRYDRDDVNPTEVHNVNELLHTSSTQFVVDDDEDEENEAEYEDEQEDVLVDSDSD